MNLDIIILRTSNNGIQFYDILKDKSIKVERINISNVITTTHSIDTTYYKNFDFLKQFLFIGNFKYMIHLYNINLYKSSYQMIYFYHLVENTSFNFNLNTIKVTNATVNFLKGHAELPMLAVVFKSGAIQVKYPSLIRYGNQQSLFNQKLIQYGIVSWNCYTKIML